MWPFKRRPNPATDKSTMALKDSAQALQGIAERHEEVLRVSADLRRIRKDNHFSEHLIRIMAEGRK